MEACEKIPLSSQAQSPGSTVAGIHVALGADGFIDGGAPVTSARGE
jgi:hypothetical protein